MDRFTEICYNNITLRRLCRDDRTILRKKGGDDVQKNRLTALTERLTRGTLPVLVARGILLAAVVLVCVFIFLNSAATAEESGGESLAVTKVLAEIAVKDYTHLPPEEQAEVLNGMHAYVRTAAHFSEYALLGFLVMLLVLSFDADFRPAFSRHWVRYPVAFGFCVLYAAGDEFHQLFVDGRVADVADVLIDSAGALFGCAVALALGVLISVICRRRAVRRFS